LKESTVTTYAERLNPFRQRFGTVAVAQITKDDIRSYRDDLIKRSKTRLAARSRLTMVSIFFRYLIEDLDMRLTNPVAGVRIALSEDDEQAVDLEEIYSDEDIAAIEAVLVREETEAFAAIGESSTTLLDAWIATKRDRSLVAILVYCGLRIGEALALNWTDIDLSQSLVTVTKTLTKKGKIQRQKTLAGRRTVAIPRRAVNVMREYKISSPHDIFCPTSTGNYLGYRNFVRSWKRINKVAGVEYNNLHDLRHYYVSKLIDAGYDDHRITSMLGHTDISFTRRVYYRLLNRRTRLTKDVEDINAGV